MEQGTEWTEPGQGATVADLFDATFAHTGNSDKAWRAIRAADFGSGGLDRAWSDRTNIRLTGHPLTAEDLKRIAECK